MNTKVFLVTVRWKNPLLQRMETLEAQLSSVVGGIAWMRFNNFVWLVKTNLLATSHQIYTALNLEAAGLEEVMIVQIDRSSRAGWTKKWAWDWIDSDQALIAGAPTAQSRL